MPPTPHRPDLDPTERLWRRLFARLGRLAKKLPRERAVIAGFVAAAGTSWLNGELTKATAVPVLVGIALRFVVTPWDSPKAQRRRAEVEDGIRVPLRRRLVGGHTTRGADFGDPRPVGDGRRRDV